MKKEIEIYRQSFGIDYDFERLLFETTPQTLKIEGETAAQLFLLPCNIVKEGNRLSAQYIFAAATEEKHRKKGYMKRLLERVIRENEGILILRPASQSLIDYYKRFSFKEVTACDRENTDFYIEPLGIFKRLSEKEKTNEGEFTLMALNSPIDLKGISFPFTMP